MAKHLLGQRKTERMQHNRPDDRVETHDFLANQMDIGRPILLKQRIVIRTVAQRVDVIGQRVHPDIDGVFRIEVHRNSPLERRARNAQILQTGDQEVIEHFSRARRRLNEIGMGLDVINQPILILPGGRSPGSSRP